MHIKVINNLSEKAVFTHNFDRFRQEKVLFGYFFTQEAT